MIVRIKKRTDPFARIDRACLEDATLSFKAKGLLAYLLSKPDDWQISVKQLSKASTDRTDSVQSGLQELEKQGYAVLEPSRNGNGSLNGKSWTVYENPNDLETKLDRQAGNRHVGKAPTDRKPVRRETGTSAEPSNILCTKKDCTNPPDGEILHLSGEVIQERKKSEPKQLPSEHQEFVGQWSTEYQNAHGRKYVFQGKDWPAVTRLLATKIPTAEVIEIAKEAWQRPNAFNCKFAAGICGFENRINDIQLEIKSTHPNGKPKPKEVIRTTPF